MKIFKLIFILTGCSILSACTVGPNYIPPKISPPNEFVSQKVIEEINTGKNKKVLQANWWQGFNDLQLDTLVRQGLEHNYEIAKAMAQVKHAQALLIIAAAGNNLSAEGNIDGGLELEKNLRAGSASERNIFAAINFTQPLDIFGKVRRRIQAANAEIEAARDHLKATTLRVSADVSKAYLELRGKQQQLILLQKSIQLEKNTRSVVSSRYRAGLAPELDLTRAEAAVAILEAAEPRIKEAIINARNKLAELTGKFPGEYETILATNKQIPIYENRIPNYFPLQVLKVRPDVLRAEAQFKRTIANIGVAEADFYPFFDIQGLVSIGTIASNVTSTLDLLLGTLNGIIKQVVIDNGVLKGNLAAAEALAQESLANYRQTLLTASQQVETTLAAIAASSESQKSLEIAVKNSWYSFKKAEAVYQQGLLSFLDVLDAQRVLVNAEQQLAIEQTNYATNIANLFMVLGANVS